MKGAAESIKKVLAIARLIQKVHQVLRLVSGDEMIAQVPKIKFLVAQLRTSALQQCFTGIISCLSQCRDE